ncbi:MAG: sulfatase [Labilibaculum antarcticum]
MKYLPYLSLAVAISSCQSPNKAKLPSQKPNIIFLMDDQHRHDALGVENPIVHTPNLDKLAKNGVRFSQAVCQAPMCVPSRNSMMLGIYPNQIGILRNGLGLQDSLLPAISLAQRLKDAGYETAGFGKTHWGSSSQPFIPSTRGFETRYIGECREEGAMMMIDIDPEKKARYSEETKNYGGGEELPAGYIGKTSEIKEGEHRDGWVFEKCIDYIKNRNDERPLFLYLSFLKPHAAHNVPQGYEQYYNKDEMPYAQQPNWDKDHSPHALGINRRDLYINFWKKASEEQWKEMTMRYYANCSWIDDMFGRALKELKEKGLLENTIIIYVSDHGEMLGERYYRFNKYCLYESSVRVPFILAGKALPDHFKNTIDKRQAELVDVYPTLLKLAGIKVPKSAVGINLMDTTQTRKASFCALHEKKGEASFMWRNSEYKLILVMNRKENISLYTASDIVDGELYKLKEDLEEYNNLFDVGFYAPIKNNLSSQLLHHLQEIKEIHP